MSKKEKLLTFYKEVLHALGCSITTDDMVTLTYNGEPVTLATKQRLVLPSDQGLANFENSNLVAFHPLSENVILGQSDVIRKTRVLVNQAITHKVLVTMLGITTAVADKVDMTSTQVSKLAEVSSMDGKTIEAMKRLMAVIDANTPQRLVNVYLKHGGSIGDNTYKRTAYVTFPLYEELVSAVDGNRDTIYGVKMRKKDVQVIRKLFELLIENADKKDYYSAGSNSKACPYFHALLTAYANVLRDLNGITWTFRKVLNETVGEEPHVTLDFIDEFGEGDAYRNVIPSLDGNQGSKVNGQEDEYQPQPTNPPQQAPQPQQQIQPPQQNQPVQQTMQVQPQTQYQQPYQQPPQTQSTQPQRRIPKIGADAPPAQGITADGYATTNQQGHVLRTSQDIMNVAYPPTLYPGVYQPPMQAPVYPTFPNGQVQQPPAQAQYPQAQYAPQGFAQPMMQGQAYPSPQFNGYGAPQPYAQPMGYPTMQGIPPGGQQMQQQGKYPKFPSANKR